MLGFVCRLSCWSSYVYHSSLFCALIKLVIPIPLKSLYLHTKCVLKIVNLGPYELCTLFVYIVFVMLALSLKTAMEGGGGVITLNNGSSFMILSYELPWSLQNNRSFLTLPRIVRYDFLRFKTGTASVHTTRWILESAAEHIWECSGCSDARSCDQSVD